MIVKPPLNPVQNQTGLSVRDNSSNRYNPDSHRPQIKAAKETDIKFEGFYASDAKVGRASQSYDFHSSLHDSQQPVGLYIDKYV